MAKNKELKREIVVCRAALGKGMMALIPKQRKMNVLMLKEFGGTRSTRDVNNFIWGIEQYFQAIGIKDDVIKVNTVVIYFSDVAILWWRHRSTNERRGRTTTGTWEEFQKKLKKQFYPQYAEKETWAKLRRFTQQGTIQEYVQEFSELMLQIFDLSEKKAF